MDSIGSGELLVILVVALLVVDPKTAGRWWAKLVKLQRRLLSVRDDFEREVRQAVDETSSPAPMDSAQARLRTWSKDRVAGLGQTEWDAAGGQILSRLRGMPEYRDAFDVAAFWPLAQEVPIRPVLEAILADGKTLWMPWTTIEPGEMHLARVQDLARDLVEGRFRIREPRVELRNSVFPENGLVLVPGEVFDLHGGRIGKGGGYYDRWLARKPMAKRVGVAWDVQVHSGKLPQNDHDMPMNALVTENRLVNFPPARKAPSVGGTAQQPNSAEESNA